MKTLKFKNIGGGKAPYKIGILGMRDATSATEFSGLPNGTFRGYIEDADLKRSFQKIDVIADPAYNTNKIVNWGNIPNFSLPSSVDICCYGWGAPRWLDEATPSDALNHGWTHTDNAYITSPSVLPASKRALFNTFNRLQFNEYVDYVVGVQPTAVNAIIVEEYICSNPTGSNRTVNYTDYTGSAASVVIPPDSEGPIYAKFGTFSPTSNDSLGDTRPYNWTACTDAALIEIGKSVYFIYTIQQNVDTDAYDQRVGLLMYDEEVFNDTERFHAKIIQGMIEQSDVHNSGTNSDFKIVWYGKPFNGWGIGLYGGNTTGNWKNKFFPYLSPTNLANLYKGSGYISNLDASVTDLYIDPVFYFKVPVPLTQTRYHKQNGNYVLDIDGERTIRKDSFTEVIRGQTVRFHIKSDYNTPSYSIDEYIAEPAYGYTDNIVPELWYAIQQFYIHASKMITLLVALHNREVDDNNIYGDLSAQKVKCCPVLRDECEPFTPGGYTSQYRPYTDFQIEWWAFSTMIICENMYLWTDYYNQDSSNAQNKGSGIYKIPGRNPDGTANWNFSQIEAYTIALAQIADLDEKHGIFGAASKRCIFYKPADTSHEIMAWGRLNGNKLLIHISESRLDFDETMTVYVKNRLNGYTQAVKLKGNQNFLDVFYLPEGSYEPKDVYIEYADIYGQNHKCTGDLREHIVS